MLAELSRFWGILVISSNKKSHLFLKADCRLPNVSPISNSLIPLLNRPLFCHFHQKPINKQRLQHWAWRPTDKRSETFFPPRYFYPWTFFFYKASTHASQAALLQTNKQQQCLSHAASVDFVWLLCHVKEARPAQLELVALVIHNCSALTVGLIAFKSTSLARPQLRDRRRTLGFLFSGGGSHISFTFIEVCSKRKRLAMLYPFLIWHSTTFWLIKSTPQSTVVRTPWLSTK